MRDKIFVNTRSLGAGLTGVQRYTLEVTARLSDEVECVAPANHARGPLGHAWEQLVLPRLVGDAVLWSPANTGPLRLRRQVVTIHDLSALDHPEWFTPAFARWYRYMLPRLATNAAAVITDSQFTRGRIVERLGVEEGRVTVIHPGVDDRFRPAAAEEVTHVRAALGLPEARYLLSLSSLEPRKNLPRLLRAWEAALPSLPRDVVLVLAGAPGGRRIFRDGVVGDLPRRVVLTGHVADRHLPALFSGATAFVYPSLYEGFGLPPLEAMASGAPVIASDRTSLPEVVAGAAILIDPYDVEALATAMVQLTADASLQRDLRDRGILQARRFTWRAAAEGVLRILNEHRGS